MWGEDNLATLLWLVKGNIAGYRLCRTSSRFSMDSQCNVSRSSGYLKNLRIAVVGLRGCWKLGMYMNAKTASNFFQRILRILPYQERGHNFCWVDWCASRKDKTRRIGEVVKAGQLLQRSFVLWIIWWSGWICLRSSFQDLLDLKDDEKDDVNKVPAPTIAVSILGVKANIRCGNEETAWKGKLVNSFQQLFKWFRIPKGYQGLRILFNLWSNRCPSLASPAGWTCRHMGRIQEPVKASMNNWRWL